MEMNREIFFQRIQGKLEDLAKHVKSCGHLNYNNDNVNCEFFYRDILNIIFNLSLVSTNLEAANFEAIDLIDDSKKTFVQVSSTATTRKVQDTLSKDILGKYKGYHLFFVFPVIHRFEKSAFENPYLVVFDQAKDLLDLNSILSRIQSLNIDRLKSVRDLVSKELGNYVSDCLPSDLSEVVDILSGKHLSAVDRTKTKVPYDIDKKIDYNNLNDAAKRIIDNSAYYCVLNSYYEQADKEGSFKNESIQNLMSTFYLKRLSAIRNDLQLFMAVVEDAKTEVKLSANFKNDITDENLDRCVMIIVVDAFIKCSIFKDPEGYKKYDTSR